jgi:signal transduction histidine kinase
VEHHPLVYRGVEVGVLHVLFPRGTRLRPQERGLLEDLVRQAGLAAHAAERTEELLVARRLLVTAREEERRRIRRDLHDGLGPVLGALTLKLDAARRLGPEEADAVLVGAKRDLGDALLDLRRLVHGLRPPALDEVGLVGALEQQLAQPRGAEAPAVSLSAEGDLASLPAAVEVAAFRITGEAVANALRHSGGTRCDVVLRHALGELVVTVADDGRGLGFGRPRGGVGLSSMQERAQEVGGSVEVTSPPAGGTLVVVRLPVHAPVVSPEPVAVP